ncbi:MAG: immune inhibitor A [Chloroflexi bacterium]|nr:immune inhibitor A [Chloroflexota bacterium]
MGRRATAKVVALLLLLAALLAACGGTGPSTPSPTAEPSPRPTATPTPSPSPPPQLPFIPVPPDRDPFELAARFRGLDPDTPRVARRAAPSYRVGRSHTFTVIDLTGPTVTRVRAVLRVVSDHAYFYVADGVFISDSSLRQAADAFETEIYPAVTSSFGSEWSPGVDRDRRITILHTDLNGAAGYFSSRDEYPRTVSPGGNQREMLYMDTQSVPPGSAAYTAVLAHELQHLVHWNGDPGEESWVNEGLSQVAAGLVGPQASAVSDFLGRPDTQLNSWVPVDEEPTPHYGASELFFGYLLDRFGGRQRARELVEVPADGIDGVNEYLSQFGTDFKNVFAEWTVANYLDRENGRFSQQGGDFRVGDATVIDELGSGEGSLHQFAADYLEVEPPPGATVFTFDGAGRVPLVGAPSPRGAFWWSNRGDGIDSRLTREFDLRDVTSAALRFRTWYDIEKGWDYAYVAASTDGGKTWRALPGRHTTTYDPIEQAYGPGYTGSSGRWVQERVDLTPYAGRKLLLRFEYVTDEGVNLPGLAVDDISIPEIGFRDRAGGDAGWEAEGFVRVDRPLKQGFVVWLIDRGGSGRVKRVPLNKENVGRVLVGETPVTIVIAPVTPVTTETAFYRWSLSAD